MTWVRKQVSKISWHGPFLSRRTIRVNNSDNLVARNGQLTCYTIYTHSLLAENKWVTTPKSGSDSGIFFFLISWSRCGNSYLELVRKKISPNMDCCEHYRSNSISIKNVLAFTSAGIDRFLTYIYTANQLNFSQK